MLVDVPGHGQVEFPDSMTREQVTAAIRKLTGAEERDAAKNVEMKATDQEIARWSVPPLSAEQSGMVDESGMPVAAPAPIPKEFPDTPSTAAIDLGKANEFKTYASPIEAGKDLLRGVYDPKTGKWFQGSDAMRDVAKIPRVLGQVAAPLSTDDPKQRQAIYVREIPGAKAAEDKYGNPMVELPDGKRYYTTGGDLDLARAALGLAGGAAIGASLPVTGPGGLILGGILGAGAQSAGEDIVAKSFSGDEGKWVNVDKLLISMGLGALPGGVIGIRNAIAKRAAAGLPLTDDALRALGMTDNQIESLTPEMRQEISNIAKRSLDNPKAVGAGYRGLLAEEAGLTGEAGLTRGEISGDVAQRIREQKLVGEKGTGTPIIEGRRAAQDVKLSESQQALIAEAGGRPGQPPLKPEDAQTILKGAKEQATATAEAGVDTAYTAARDPAAVVAAGGTADVPVSHAGQFSDTARKAVEASDATRVALGPSAAKVTPQAKGALDAVERFSKDAVGSKANLTWQQVEDLRQELLGYRSLAAEAAARPGGSSRDLAAVNKVINSFDDHFGTLNPLYAPARKAKAELESVFTAGGHVDQDAATKAVLKVMDGPQGGAAIVDTMFGPNFSKGQAGQMLEHLNTRVFKDHPEARDAIREMAVRRLFLDEKGGTLSPQKAVTKLEAAFGDRELSTYQNLLTGEQLASLRRAHELLKTLAESRKPINPSGTGSMIRGLIKDVIGGGGLGAMIGSGAGYPGMLAGAAMGTAYQNQAPKYLANRALNPPPGYFQTATTPSKVPGILGTAAASVDTSQPPGPADRLMEGLLR